MARSNERSTRRSPKDAARKTKKKPCALCRDKVEWVDYKDVGLLRKYMSDRGKIRARRVTGNCTQHQRDIALAIKTARELVLLPYTQRTMTERGGGRTRTRGERSERGAEQSSAEGARQARPAAPPDAEKRPEASVAAQDAGQQVEKAGTEEAGTEEAEISANGADSETTAVAGESPAGANGSGGRDVTGDGA